MPGNLLNADIGFPQLTSEQSTDEKIGVIQNYLYMLLEQMRYTLGNLDVGNFNDAGFEEISKLITDPITINLSSVEKDITTLKLTADGLKLSVENADKQLSQTVRVAADGVTITNAAGSQLVIDGGQINAENLNLTGRITFSDLTADNQELISDTATAALAAQEKANSAYDLAFLNQLPEYITETKITKTEIESPTITAATINSAILNSPEIYTNTLEVIGDLVGKDYASIQFKGKQTDGNKINLFSLKYTAATSVNGLTYPTLVIAGDVAGTTVMLGNSQGYTGIYGARVAIEAQELIVPVGMITNLCVNIPTVGRIYVVGGPI